MVRIITPDEKKGLRRSRRLKHFRRKRIERAAMNYKAARERGIPVAQRNGWPEPEGDRT